MSKHPIQPLVEDERGVVRFKANAIVQWLLDNGGLSMNDIAVQDFSQEDREQFAQLIGYSHSGAGDLSYMGDEVLNAAWEMYKFGKSEQEARNLELRTKLESVREDLREGIATLYGIHPDDLRGRPL